MESRASASGRGMDKEAPISPGPVYYPNLAFIGNGPNGKGVEYGMRGSYRVSIEEKKTTQAERPGPKYMLPSGLGRQYDSTKESLAGGAMARGPRKTIDTSKFPGKDSPGPAAYNRETLGLQTVVRQRKAAPVATGMGGAQRFFSSENRTQRVPGPGQYPIPQSIGGRGMPHKDAAPVYAFSKASRDSKASLPQPAHDSPGPVYKLKPSVGGNQVDARRPSSAQYGFGTGSRFPVSAEENRAHLEQVKRVKKAGRRPGSGMRASSGSLG